MTSKPRQRRSHKRRASSRRERGVALVMVLMVIAVITVLVSEMSQNTSTEFQVSVSQRDRLRAEYIARSGLNLTRLLINHEKPIRQMVGPLFQLMGLPAPAQINVWRFADTILAPFSNYKAAKGTSASIGIDFSQMQGLADTGGSFEITAFPENSMININDGPYQDAASATKGVAMQLYAMMGGFQPQGPYDVLFDKLDADGKQTTRLDIISDIIDWWDQNEQKTVFDPGALQVTSAGGEDDVYSQFPDPYRVKNAPFDSLEELRMVRGVGDDFWSTFVEPNPDDPRSRRLTIYGSGRINPNEAPPEVLLARICSFTALQVQPLCADPMQGMAFVQLLGTSRMFPIPFFSRASDFLDFLQGKGMLFGLLSTVLTPQSPMLAWKLLVPPPPELSNAFAMSAAIFTIQSVGRVGHTSVRLNTVVNFDDKWNPPPPNPGRNTGQGILHYYRVD